MKGGNKPATPRCALGAMQLKQMDVEEVKRDGWNRHGILVVRADDARLGWIEQKVIIEIGKRLYGQKGARLGQS